MIELEHFKLKHENEPGERPTYMKIILKNKGSQGYIVKIPLSCLPALLTYVTLPFSARGCRSEIRDMQRVATVM